MSTIRQAVEPLNWADSGLKASCRDPAAYGCNRWNNTSTYFSSGLPTPPGPKAMPAVVLGNNYAGYSVPAYQQDRSNLADSTKSSQQYATSTPGTNHSYALAPPAAGSSLYNRRVTNQNDADVIAPHLQIPASVNKSKGSLAEFAAEITSLFWFETSNTLQYAENLSEEAPVDRGLLPDALPSVGFRKWVTTIISTTQVGKNVILLALMFIYRLKRFNPTVSGKRGSEFRLLTIALMLGNKFLDDNTYTNKTWAEVSGISVTEIHIMEVEFLSNMRYDLYASAEEWSEWKAKLGRLGAFYQKASQLPSVNENRGIGLAPITPTGLNFPHKLPSPPSTHHSANSYATSSSMTNHYPVLPHPHPSASAPPLPSSPLRQQVDAKGYRQERKRSADYSAEFPPAKRQLFAGQMSGPGSNLSSSLSYARPNFKVSPTRSSGISDLGLDIPRLPVSFPPPSAQPTPLSAQPSRAMSGVYPAPTNGYSHPVTPISAIPQNIFHNPIPNLGDQRSMSNHPSAHTSPNGYNTTPPTLPGLSPSYFLTHRTSPYRPVRHVTTLLNPPPSAALQAPVRNIALDQMYYQPLSKVATDPRTGQLPYYQPEAWQNSNVSTPVVQQHYQF